VRGEGDSGPGPPHSGGGHGLGADVALGFLCAGLAILARLCLHPVLGFTLPYTTVFLAVALIALWRGWRAAAVCGIVAIPLAILLFVEPPRTLSLPTFGDRAALVGFLIVTCAVVAVSDATRRGLVRAQQAALAARRAAAGLL
jgi:K+-sensing histidine kinase KdpD